MKTKTEELVCHSRVEVPPPQPILFVFFVVVVAAVRSIHLLFSCRVSYSVVAVLGTLKW